MSDEVRIGRFILGGLSGNARGTCDSCFSSCGPISQAVYLAVSSLLCLVRPNEVAKLVVGMVL